jgi:hypothetical protein
MPAVRDVRVGVGGASVLLVDLLDGAVGRARERLAFGGGGQGHKRRKAVCAYEQDYVIGAFLI